MAEADHDPVEGWTPPSAKERLALIREHRSVAMVGVSSNPARPSNFVATYLLSYPEDFEVTFVNPRETEILGRPVVPSLKELPEPPGIVDAFRRPEDLPAIAQEAIEVAPRCSGSSSGCGARRLRRSRARQGFRW